MRSTQEAVGSGFESFASTFTGKTTPRKAAAGDPLAVDQEEEKDGMERALDGVAARLHMQALMNDRAQKALVVQSKLMMGGISRFRVVVREIVGTAFFDVMVCLLVLVDMICLVAQQELYPEADAVQDSTEMILRSASVAVTVAFAVEFVARTIAQIGLGWSWLLCLDGLIVAGSFAEVILYALDPTNAAALRFLRPLRGLRLLRAVRGSVRVLRRSSGAMLALNAFERSMKPLALIGAFLMFSLWSATVFLVLQIPGTFNELEDPEIQQEVLEKFGDVLACTSTVLQVIFGSHDIGDLMIKIFRSGGSGRDQITMFVGSVFAFLLVSSLCVSGVVCGVLLSQVIVEKGDAEVDGGMEAFRKNQELVHSLNEVFKEAGFGTGDQIDWNDILTVLAVNEAGRPARHEPSPEHLLGRGTSNLEVSHGEDAAYRCILEDKGLTMEEIHAAYEEMALFGAVCVEDFILCAFRHVAHIKTVSMLSFNHQQNKVFSRMQFHGQLVDEALREMRWRIGRLHSVLPSMISEVETAACELKDLDELEARLDEKKKALRSLIDEKEKACGFAEIPKDEVVQAQRDEHDLCQLLEAVELQVERLGGQSASKLSAEDASGAIHALADEMAQHLWSVVLEDMKASEQPPNHLLSTL